MTSPCPSQQGKWDVSEEGKLLSYTQRFRPDPATRRSVSLELDLYETLDWRGLPILPALLPALLAAIVSRLEKRPSRKVSNPTMFKGLPVGEELRTRPLTGRPSGEWLGSRYQGNHRAWNQEPQPPEELRAVFESLGAPSSGGGSRFLPIDFCLRIVPRGRPRNGPFGLPGTVGVITAIPWRSYTDCKPESQVRCIPGSPTHGDRARGHRKLWELQVSIAVASSGHALPTFLLAPVHLMPTLPDLGSHTLLRHSPGQSAEALIEIRARMAGHGERHSVVGSGV